MRACVQHIVEVCQVDPADCEPGHGQVICCPSHITQRDRFGGGFCSCGVYRANSHVICSCSDCAHRLFRGVRADSNSTLRIGDAQLGNMGVSRVKKILLAQVTKVGSNFLGDIEV